MRITAGKLLLAASGIFWSWGCSGLWGTSGEPDVTGWVEAKTIVGPSFPNFRARYDTVEVNADLIEMIARLREGVEAVVFFGPWCSDSRREVPHFIKVIERAGFPPGSVRYYALDRSKRSADGVSDKYRIERVATFVFLRDGKEIGRITELPRSSLEGDLYEILVADLKRRSQGGG